MEEWIKKSDAIEAIKGNSYLNDDYIEINGYGAIEDIRTLPSADRPKGEWIPCSERLPAYGEDVLISIGGYCNVGHIVSVNEEEQYNWYFSGWYHLPNDVDAWMPLPEPWKGADDE